MFFVDPKDSVDYRIHKNESIGDKQKCFMADDGETPRPTIDIDSPPADHPETYKDFIKYNKVDYARMYYIMKKFRTRQRILLGEDKSDPDPFMPTYIFYCFTGNL